MKNKGGRPQYEPTDEQREIVAILKAAGSPDAAIARTLKIDDDTLVKHFREELKDGGEGAIGQAARCLYQRGLNGDTAALIFWLKTRGRGRFKESQDLNVTLTGAVESEILASRINELARKEARAGNSAAPSGGA